jgi:hypothetical protein
LYKRVYCESSAFGAANGTPRLLRGGRDTRITSIVAQLLGTSTAVTCSTSSTPSTRTMGSSSSLTRTASTAVTAPRSGATWKAAATVVAIDDSTPARSSSIRAAGGGGIYAAWVRRRFGKRPGVPALLAAGSAAFFSPYLVHRSAENRGARPRRIAINGFVLPGANSRPYFGAGTGVALGLLAGAACG